MEPNVAQILEKRALLTPHRLGLVEWESGRRFQYQELDQRANRIANHLRRLGVGQGDRVSILASNGVYYVDIFFGLGKLGAVLTPLNWRLALPEQEYILNDSKPRVLLFGPEYAETAERLRQTVDVKHSINLEDYEDLLEESSPEPPPPTEVPLEDPHTIFYTSGTTGRPKGAILPHRMILWNSFNTIISWELTGEDAAPIFTPMFHSGGFNVVLVPLFHLGGRIVLTRSFDPEEALRLIEQERATIVFMVPTMFGLMAESPRFAEADLGSVKFFISGGAPCPVELIRLYQARGLVFKQGFGMTEAGVNCFSMTAEESFQKQGSVGKPIFHSQVTIVDEEGHEVGTEEVGELVIAGPHVCSGYWGKPQATAEALVDGWFHSGDLAKRDGDGFYYIVGRKKDMIISGGENIYLAEVEGVIAAHPQVKEVAVIGVPDPKWGEVGRAVVVLRPGQTATEREIKEFCEGKLARYKIPKSVVFATALPRNPYGKVIRAELQKSFGEVD